VERQARTRECFFPLMRRLTSRRRRGRPPALVAHVVVSAAEKAIDRDAYGCLAQGLPRHPPHMVGPRRAATKIRDTYLSIISIRSDPDHYTGPHHTA
jgi:hypothetical protein